MNQLDMNGRGAIVTGGAAGIGYAIAQRLVASNARVSLWDRDADALRVAAQNIGGDVHTQRLDVTREGEVARACDSGIAALGRIDALVCSAGITGPNTT
ncbi:MAG: SDR family NAD(P)-dependent oxidoreductase, partial [Burkholderiaceae bacterium]